MDDSNNKNPNNWHWVSKDVFSWTKNYLTEKLLTIAADGVRVTCVSDVLGDASVLLRKGKLRYIFDLSMTINFASVDGDGKLHISELTHDSATIEENNELVLRPESQADKCKVLYPHLRKFFATLGEEMLSKNMAIPNTTTQTKPASMESQNVPEEKRTPSKTSGKLSKDVEFCASTKDVEECFSNADKKAAWGGTFVDFVSKNDGLVVMCCGKKVVITLKSTNFGCLCKFEFEKESASTLADVEYMIKSAFGYGKL